jgi:hypothetical protein
MSRRLERDQGNNQMEGISVQVTTKYGRVWISTSAPYYCNWTGKAITAARLQKIHGHA